MTRTLILLFCACLMAFSQVSTSEITGTVRDSTGAVVPGAQVTARNEATGITYRQTTTNSGLYAFAALPAALYTVSAEMTGFKRINRTGNQLVVGTPL
ncbi:MAG: carboxypeptidase-like regulatory domain-containing protein, partial [Acidobacteriota bacterium]|nr:carboxypeptidase-like regulatory domain-containing protein [Acidobacteriota bacterium]